MSTSPSYRRKKKEKKNQWVWNTDANHYLDVFRLMSTSQVTCVDVCQRSRNVPTTYGQRMRNVCHTPSTSRNFQHAENLSTYSAYYDVCQRASTCFSVLLTYTKLTHNVFDVCQRIRQIFHTSAYANKSSRCDSGLTLRCLVRLLFESSSRSLLIGYATWSSAIRCRAICIS